MTDSKKCLECGKTKGRFAPWFYWRSKVCYGHPDIEIKKFLEPIEKSEIQNDDTLCIWHNNMLRRVKVSDLMSWIKERS